MNNIISFEFPQILFFLLIPISAILFIVLNWGNSQLNVKKNVWISLLIIFVLSIGGLFGLSNSLYEGFWFFIFIQLLTLTTGIILNKLFLKNYFSSFNTKIISEISYSFFIISVSYFLFSFLFNYLSKTTLGYTYATSLLFLIIPYFITLAFDHFIHIPASIYKVWYLNEEREEPDFDKINVRDVYLLSLDLLKNVNDKGVSNIKVKAPLEMNFGDWYQSFILNYNEKFTDNMIQFKFLDGSSMGWVFYTKPSFFYGRRFIDPNKKITQNKLNEKVTIVAYRVKINYN
jgi:hypothetical protein